MHISEGTLAAPVLITGAILTLGGTALGLRNLSYDRLPLVAVLSSTFFVASLIHLPVGVSAVHLVLNGLCGLLLGWAAFPAILVGLALQALLFQFGGLTTLGLNTFTMAFPAVVMGYGCSAFVHSPHVWVRAGAGFVCGAGAVFFSAVLVALALLATGESFWANAATLIISSIPVMIVEGIVTAVVIEFVRKVRPVILTEA